MYNKKLYFKNNYQKELFINSRLERIKYIDKILSNTDKKIIATV